MVISSLSPTGLPFGQPDEFVAKTPADYPPIGLLIEEFDIWREGYGQAVVRIYRAGTTELIPIYAEPDLTGEQQVNPQTLLLREDDLGNSFGKFITSLYSPFPYELDINTTEQTGQRLAPITTLDGEDASSAIVTTFGGTVARRLNERFADIINALDYGELGSSPETNSNTIAAAISAASTNGGGRVYLPGGVTVFNQISLPSNVILIGDGKGVTILRSQVAAKVVTVAGDYAGMEDLTLDGVNVITGSIGIYGRARSFISLKDVEVKRFATGIHWQGGQNHVYRNLFVTNNARNVRLLGDSDSSGTGNGDEFSGLDWFQGEVSLSTIVGIELAMVDLPCRHNSFHQVDFIDNIGEAGAVNIYGASWNVFRQCYWDGNESHLIVTDAIDDTLDGFQVVGLNIEGGQFIDGVVEFDGLCQDIMLDQMEITGTEFQMNVPVNQIVLRDSVEEDTLITGDATKLTRFRTSNNGVVKGTTTNATPVVVWKSSMAPNEVILLNTNATAEQVNGTDFAVFSDIHAARCAPATLAYDEQTVNFTVGSEIIGQTSGARAFIVADSDGGTTGTLSLGQVSGAFVDNEIITEEGGSGSARTNGTMTLGTASLIGSATSVHAAGSDAGSPPSGWEVTFAVSQQELQVLVTGESSGDIFWNVRVDETRL